MAKEVSDISEYQRHIRWNYEPSPANESMTRYHFVVIGENFKGNSFKKIHQYFEHSGKDYVFLGKEDEKRNGKLRKVKSTYDILSYDSFLSADSFNWSDIDTSFDVKRDKRITDSSSENLEEIVQNLFLS